MPKSKSKAKATRSRKSLANTTRSKSSPKEKKLSEQSEVKINKKKNPTKQTDKTTRQNNPTKKKVVEEQLSASPSVSTTTPTPLYCTAEPGSDEWREYQANRLKSIKSLKSSKVWKRIQQQQLQNSSQQQIATAVAASAARELNVSSILKKSTSLNRKRSISNKSDNSIRWKYPVDDEEETQEELLKRSGSKSSTTVSKKSTKKSVKKSSTNKSLPIPTTKKKSVTMKKKPAQSTVLLVTPPTPRKSISRSHSGKFSTPNSSASSVPSVLQSKLTIKSNSNLSTKGTNLSTKGNELNSVRPAQRKPPKFPSLETCNVFPGTPEWDTYWAVFNFKIKEYNEQMDEYGKGIDEFSKDLEDYSQKLKRITMEDQAFQIQLGMRPRENRPPILREPLSQTMTMIGGYMIKRKSTTNSKTSKVLAALTSFDHVGFRLEIQFPNSLVVVDMTDAVRFDTKFNLLVINLKEFDEEIHIGCPTGKKVDTHLKVGYPLHNNGKLVITGV